MFNSLNNLIRKNTGLLIRLDDISENMSWKHMDKCELLFDKFNIKPLLGIIPENKDPELLNYPKNSNFWERVESWKKKGWEISMHGYSHLYERQTNKKDIFNYGGRSEFFGLSYENQLYKIKSGLEKFSEKNISIRSFFAPNHTYDKNTFIALKNCGKNQIIDGYGFMPYVENDIKFIPQLFYKVLALPFGIQTTQIHLNYWKSEDFNNFEKFIEKNSNKIITYDQALNKINNNFFYKFINKSLSIILKFKRIIKSK